MKLFNTLGRELQDFKSLTPGKVSFYHCGPTVYWTQQVGNMFAMVQADLIRKSLEYVGYDVTFVRNYTDVGHLSGDNDGDADTGVDRMEKASARESKTPEEIAAYYAQEFDSHTDMLGIQKPDHAPYATSYITEMIDLTQQLLDRDFAYQTDLAIYFDTSKKNDYYKLSGQKKSDLRAGSGHGDVHDTSKKNESDFALWFFKAGSHKHALQTWDNPFSTIPGFPGWHIECSAMIKALLGKTIDIHMGGIEHIPIHHTNEIAQSESAHDAPLANYWLHNEHLLYNGAKMSKSAGTALTVIDVIERGFDPLDLRYFFLQAHYRSQLNFTWEALEAAAKARRRLITKVQALPEGGVVNPDLRSDFIEQLNHEINIPAALAVIADVFKSDIDNADKKATIIDFDRVLGLGLGVIKEIDSEQVVPEEVQDLLERRAHARATKDWQESDRLRDEIAALGYEIKDSAAGQEVVKK